MLGSDPPPQVTTGYTVEFVWRQTSYVRMKKGLKRFWKDETSISSYLYYKLLGKDIQPPVLELMIPDIISAPNLPELNIYQIEAVRKALQSPLCLIQGPPGTGKTVTSASIVDHLAEKIHKTG